MSTEQKFDNVKVFCKPYKMFNLIYAASMFGCAGINVEEYVLKYSNHFDYIAQFDNTFTSAYNECVESVFKTGILGNDATSIMETVITDDNRDPYMRSVIDVAYGVYKYYLEHGVDLKDHCSFNMILDPK